MLVLLMPILRYRALHSSYFDLGQYVTNYVLAAVDGHWGIAFRSHAHPIMLIAAPIFALLPRPETLLLLQSALLIAGLAIYARLWQTVGAGDVWAGAALGILSISLWSAALFDYHFEHFLFLLYPLFFLRLETGGRYIRIELVAIALGICLVKENYALTSAMLGCYLVIDGRHRRLGAAIAALATAYFLLATMKLIPAFSDGRQAGDLWHEAFAYLGRTPLEILLTVATRPWIIVEAGLLSPRKLVFMGALGIPCALALWRAPLLMLPALPHIAIMLLSRTESHSYLANQYTVPIVLPLLVAMAYAVARVKQETGPASGVAARAHHPLLILGYAGSLAVLLMFGLAPGSRLFLSPSAWSFNAAAYARTSRDADIEALILTHVPAHRAVVVSSQNTVHHGRLSTRTHALAFPQGVLQPEAVLRAAAIATHGPAAQQLPPDIAARPTDSVQAALAGRVYADYVVIDLKRPLYMGDRPAPAGSPPGRDFEALLARLPQTFTKIVDHDGFQVWRRRDIGPSRPS